jgi:predicted aspartyl protease
MTGIKSFAFYLLLITLVGCSQKVSNQVVDGRLNDLLERKDYFKLRDELSKNESQLTEDRILYYNAFIKKAFGEREESNKDIDALLEKYTPTLDDTAVVALLDAQAANYLYLYQYQKAAAIFEEILTKHASTLDSADAASYKNAKLLFGTFADTPPQKMHKPKDVSLASYRNQFNHLMTPVKVDTVKEDFIFDTGANLSTISESQALKMNLRIFEQSVDIGSSTQNEIRSKLAVADSFYVGEILFENVLFLVMPDDQLTFPEVAYTIKGIIGFPVIQQLGEVHLKKDGSIFVPKVASQKCFSKA